MKLQKAASKGLRHHFLVLDIWGGGSDADDGWHRTGQGNVQAGSLTPKKDEPCPEF